MNQQPPTIQNPSVNGTTSDDIQYVPYYAVQPPMINTTPSQQPTIYPWSGINQIPFNFIPPTIPSVVHSDVELNQVPTQTLIPSSNNNAQQVTSTSAANTSNPFRSFFSKWRNCKHSQQRRFLKSLKSKTWTRIPRAVGVFSLLFIILSIAFFLTIGKSADNNLLNYRKGMCNINTDKDNSIVHFDYEHGMYYLELNVSVAHRNMGPGGPEHDDLHPNRPPQHNNREIDNEMKSRPDFPKNSRGSFILSRVCAYPLQQQTLDCRDRVTKYGEISCYIDEERMRLMEMLEMFHNFEKSYKKGKEGKEGKPSKGEQQPPHGERRALEETTKQEGHREGRNKYLEDIVATRQTVGRRFRRSLRCNIPGFLIVSVIAIVIFFVVGFKVLDGKSRRSCDRFIRQYFANPFEGTGEVYKLDEVSSSAIVIQDPNEPKHRTLLSSSTLKMENTPHQERILQKRLSKFWKLMRSTATKATESLLLYEKPAKKNISCHGKKHGACNGQRKIGRILCVLVKVALILFVVGLIAYGAIHTGVSIFRLKIFSGFLHFYFTLGVIAVIAWFTLFKRRSVHYLITSERIAKVIELPLRLRMNLISVSYDKIKGVWAEENRIYVKTVNSKGVERSGMIFEHVVDPTFVVNLIKQQIEPNTTESAVETQQQD